MFDRRRLDPELFEPGQKLLAGVCHGAGYIDHRPVRQDDQWTAMPITPPSVAERLRLPPRVTSTTTRPTESPRSPGPSRPFVDSQE